MKARLRAMAGAFSSFSPLLQRGRRVRPQSFPTAAMSNAFARSALDRHSHTTSAAPSLYHQVVPGHRLPEVDLPRHQSPVRDRLWCASSCPALHCVTALDLRVLADPVP